VTAIAKYSALLFFLLAGFRSARAQVKDAGVFKDTLDGAFDLSRFLIDLHGFIPVPILITEPALGGIGGGLATVFLKKRPPRIDTIRGKARVIRTQPDITGAAALYTANKTWALLGFQRGTWMKMRSKYMVAGGLASLNLSFFRTTPAGKDARFDFNLSSIPVIASLSREVNGTYWSAGLRYVFLSTRLTTTSADADFLRDKELSSIVSMPQIIVDYDNRDNMFTPDKGYRLHVSYGVSDEVVGSDYNYSKLSMYSYSYLPLAPRLVGGARIEIQQVFGDLPFYLLPYIDLRGIPIMRYQGNAFSLIEGEVRWDCTRRWSVVGFAGSGKAFDSWGQFSESSWRSTGGAGFRYLLARLFKVRIGIDVARGPEQWTYYLILGSAWLK
jgi:hypothetical protein